MINENFYRTVLRAKGEFSLFQPRMLIKSDFFHRVGDIYQTFISVRFQQADFSPNRSEDRKTGGESVLNWSAPPPFIIQRAGSIAFQEESLPVFEQGRKSCSGSFCRCVKIKQRARISTMEAVHAESPVWWCWKRPLILTEFSCL